MVTLVIRLVAAISHRVPVEETRGLVERVSEVWAQSDSVEVEVPHTAVDMVAGMEAVSSVVVSSAATTSSVGLPAASHAKVAYKLRSLAIFWI